MIFNLKTAGGFDSARPTTIAKYTRGIIIEYHRTFCFIKSLYGNVYMDLLNKTSRTYQNGDIVQFNLSEWPNGDRSASQVKMTYRPQQYSEEQKSVAKETFYKIRALSVEQKLDYLLPLHHQFPDMLQVITSIISCYFRNFENNKEAIGFYVKQMLKIAPIDSYTLFMSGKFFRLNGDYENSIKQFNKAILLNPKNVFALTNIAQIEMKMKNYENAKKVFNEILKINPKSEAAIRGIEWADLLIKKANAN